MADKKVSDFGTPSGGPASGDKLYLVDVSDTTDNAAGSGRADTITNVVTKGHGLSDGVTKVASGTMTTATAGTDYYAPGSTDVAVADGGTGASDASGARTNLGLVIGTNVQAYDADLADIAGITGAQGDIIYRNATNWTKLGAGSAGYYLQTAGTGANPSWQPTSGQFVFDQIVASSGGTHTTLGAAIAAASAGYRILVLDGTTESGAITSSLAGLQIVGAGRNTTVALGTNVLTLSGANVTIENLGFSMSTGGIVMSGNTGTLDKIYVNTSSNGANNVTLSGTGARMINSELNNTYASAANTPYVLLSGQYSVLKNCKFTMTNLNNTGTTTSTIYATGSNVLIEGLEIDLTTIASSATFIYATSGSWSSVIGCSAAHNTLVNAYFVHMRQAGGIVALNTIKWCGTPIYIDSDLIVVSGNYIESRATSNTICISINSNADWCTVQGNTITAGGASGSYGVYAAGTNNGLAIIGNTFRSVETNIGISSGTDCIVTNNVFSNYTTYMIDSSTGSTILNNTPATPVWEKRHLYMKNTSGGTINAGAVVVLKQTVAAMNEITTTTTGGDNKVFGMAIASISNNAFGQIQVLGKTTLLKADGTADIAVGDFLSTFTTAEIVKKATAGETAIAIALEAFTTDASSGVLDALIIPPRPV